MQAGPEGIVPVGLDDESRTDYRSLDAAAEAIGRGLRVGMLVVLETTVPVGTTRQMASIVHEGGYNTILRAYSALGTWIEENGYRITGPCREIYIHHVPFPHPVLRHELAHVALGQFSPVWPRWFQEGVAQHLTGEHEPTHRRLPDTDDAD